METNVKTVQTTLPSHLVGQVESLVQEGWFQDIDELIADALRRFLETHRPEIMEQYILRDVEWGLHGQE